MESTVDDEWSFGMCFPTRYVALGLEFDIQYSRDESHWRYVSATELPIASQGYPETIQSSYEHFRDWVLSTIPIS